MKKSFLSFTLSLFMTFAFGQDFKIPERTDEQKHKGQYIQEILFRVRKETHELWQ